MTGRGAGLFGVLIATAIAAPSVVSAQDDAGPRAAVAQLFEGMRTSDSGMVRAVFAESVRFAVLDERGGPVSIRSQSVEGWLSAIDDSNGSWDERVYDVDVRVEGRMASVWAPYTFYRDGEISHCGINSIELLRDADGWKVTQLSDTRRASECPDPLGAG